MRFTALFLSALTASSAVAIRTCGALIPTDEQKLISQNFQLQEASERRFAFPNSTISANITVNIYWHVVATSTSESGGYLSQSKLDAQLDILNEAFAPQGVSFTEAGVDWTVNADWASDRGEVAMKTALRKGTYADMNVYFLASSQYLGYAYYPVAFTDAEFILDGVVAIASSVPGGTAPYDLGHTLTHEAGHWFGLAHTFGDGDGSCTGDGDFVSDTPFEATPAFDCQVGRDTCPNDPGTDPVTNFMDYSDDACFTGFSTGQTARIVSFWDAFRAQFVS